MSARMSGDWIDNCVHHGTRVPVARITLLKEKHFTFAANPASGSARPLKPQDQHVLRFLQIAYRDMLTRVFTSFATEIHNVKKVNQDVTNLDTLELVVAGGTSQPSGFEAELQSVLTQIEFPLRISTCTEGCGSDQLRSHWMLAVR